MGKPLTDPVTLNGAGLREELELSFHYIEFELPRLRSGIAENMPGAFSWIQGWSYPFGNSPECG